MSYTEIRSLSHHTLSSRFYIFCLLPNKLHSKCY